MIELHDTLSSEIRLLKEMLAEVPEEAVFDRLSLEGRLKAAVERLESLPLDKVRKRTSLTFRGSPVRGSRGIGAEFGGRATKHFSDAYAAIVAGMKENLRYMGPIPDRANHDLLIVGTAIGSFGFEFELPPVERDLLFDGHTIEERAVESIRALMQVSTTGDDEEISGIVEDIHPRAVRKVADFLQLLAQNDATCALEVGGRAFRYQDADQVSLSAKRLADENIREFEESLYGAFIGILPKSRNFEFEKADNRDVIRGKLSPDIGTPEQINKLLNKLITVRFEVFQVGQGRPRYNLPDLDAISGG